MDYFNLERMKYWSLPATFKGDKKEKINTLLKSGKYLGALKKDGDWSAFIKQNGKFEQQARTESVNGGYNDKSEHVPHISQALDLICKDGTILVGELYYPGLVSKDVGTILRCLPAKAVARQKDNPLHFYIFDVWAFDGEELFTVPFEERIQTLLHIEENVGEFLNANNIEFAHYASGQNLIDLLAEGLEYGEEGIVATLRECPVYFKRTPAWSTIKVKKEIAEDLDVFLTGNYKEATKEYKGDHIDGWEYWENEKTGELLQGKYLFTDYFAGAALLPISKNYFLGIPGSLEIGVYKDGKVFPIGFVAGLTENLRKDVIDNLDKYKLKPCRVQAMEIHDTDGLRHPKFMGFRDDIDAKDCTWEKIYG
jgi:ATP-dependent DNA ligase